MSKLDLINQLYEYNDWATNRLLETAAPVPEEDLRKQTAASYTTIIASFAHVAGAQVSWLTRWNDAINLPTKVQFAQWLDLDAVRGALDASHQETPRLHPQPHGRTPRRPS